MIKPEAYSSVVLLHSPDKVIVQERPNVPGKLAYNGKWQFLGGGRDSRQGVLEPARDAAVRELDEETNLGGVDPSLLQEQWAGLIRLDKSLEVIETHQDNLAPFALERLREFVKFREAGSELY